MRRRKKKKFYSSFMRNSVFLFGSCFRFTPATPFPLNSDAVKTICPSHTLTLSLQSSRNSMTLQCTQKNNAKGCNWPLGAAVSNDSSYLTVLPSRFPHRRRCSVNPVGLYRPVIPYCAAGCEAAGRRKLCSVSLNLLLIADLSQLQTKAFTTAPLCLFYLLLCDDHCSAVVVVIKMSMNNLIRHVDGWSKSHPLGRKHTLSHMSF